MSDLPHLTDRETLDAQIRVLMTHGHTLAEQIAELTIGQQEAAKYRASADVRLRHVEINLQQNTEVTLEVRDLLGDFKSGFKVLGWLGMSLKWAGMIAGALTTLYVGIYMLTHGGQTPGSK